MKEDNKLFYKIGAGVSAVALGLGIAVYSAGPNKENCLRTVEPMDVAHFYMPDQNGEKIELKELMAKSVGGEKAKHYAKSLAEEAFKTRKENYSTLEEKVDLAEETMDKAISFLKEKKYGGKGNYIRGYEYSPLRENWKKQIMESNAPENVKKSQLMFFNATEVEGAESAQTFDQFYGPKDERLLAGDCEDFSVALTTVYHAVKNYAEANKDEDCFYKALAEGFEHYTMTSVFIRGHALNLSIKAADKTGFRIIDLTNMDYKWSVIIPKMINPVECEALGEKPLPESKSCHLFRYLTLLKEKEGSPHDPEIYHILAVFNNDFLSSGLQIREVCENK